MNFVRESTYYSSLVVRLGEGDWKLEFPAGSPIRKANFGFERQRGHYPSFSIRFRSVFDDNLYTLKYRGYTEHPRRNIADFPRGYLRLLLLFRDSREFGSGFEANSRRKSCNESILNALRVTIYSINKDNIYIERERTSKFIILNLI